MWFGCLNIEIPHTEQRILIYSYVLEHSACREEQDVSDFVTFFSRASKKRRKVAFWEFAFVSNF